MGGIRLIISGEKDCTGCHHLIEDDIATTERAGIIIKVAGHADAQFGRLGEVHVDVGAD